ncbi:DUF397 domain-containing protein [Streptomyces sp. CRN 30]|uniref:DUF397 domain-containing protein n=1 Tax=Streptomyces sp. CRN 30 TaxID=3075613 RepID=UPI002A817B17|nr:DUF397 domain-containing protein [Streptomyces sp. CRN 30]
MVDSGLPGRTWFSSSYSQDGQDCVEVAIGRVDDGVRVRDTKRRRAAVLAFRHSTWCGFLAGLVDPESRGA